MKLVSGNVFYLMWYILERQTLIYRYLRNGRLFSQSESEICVIKKGKSVIQSGISSRITDFSFRL